MFSLASYPYSLKLLWSPFVDAFFVPRFGRRKTWIVPTQCVLGALLFLTSFIVERVLATVRAARPPVAIGLWPAWHRGPAAHGELMCAPPPQHEADVTLLTVLFFLTILMAATQVRSGQRAGQRRRPLSAGAGVSWGPSVRAGIRKP